MKTAVPAGWGGPPAGTVHNQKEEVMDFALAAQIGGFVALFSAALIVEIQNRSLRQQVTEQREVGHSDRLLLEQKDKVIALQDKEIATLQELANEAVESKQVVEGMNRMLVEEYTKKTEAAAKRRETLAAKRDGS